MAQSIKCTHCGAVMKSANPIPAGKKVKCPKCGQAFAVEAEKEENPFATGDAGGASESKAGGAKEPAKKGKGMLIGLIVGGVLLLCCCCPGLGGGGYLVWDKFLSGPNLQGGWLGKDDQFASMLLMPGGKAIVSATGAAPKMEDLGGNATWKVDGKTLELSLNDTKGKISWADSDRAKFTFELKDDILTLTNTKDSKKTVFKKGEKK